MSRFIVNIAVNNKFFSMLANVWLRTINLYLV
nr:MAG TPA: hypothetical protein [Caudoviricetes sp.]DAN42645.1 MAG TPA: hypothetical protein [Caudoviricetes sp.]